MIRYLLRRLLHSLLLLFGVSVLSFVFIGLAPGDFFDELRLNPQISPQTIAALRSQYGLDQSLVKKYTRWLSAVARGELGYSIAYNTPVAPLLLPRAANTLLLTVTSTAAAWFLALVLGTWSAETSKSWVRTTLNGLNSLLLGIPDLVLALAFLLLAAQTRWFPVGGMMSVDFDGLTTWGKARDLAAHLFLPATALTLSTLPFLLPHVRTAVSETLEAPFIRAARGHGISRPRLLFRHVLPASANPLISLFGFSVASLLSSSLLIEAVMSWPGLGRLLLEAILARDVYLVIGAVMFSTLLLIAGNLVADGLLYWSDPRIRTGER